MDISLGVKALTTEMGIELEKSAEINSDAGAAIGISNRNFSGKVRHLEVTRLGLQDKVSQSIAVNDFSNDANMAGVFTKGADQLRMVCRCRNSIPS